MRKNLNEDLKRIHRLIYGKSLIKEDVIDTIVSKPNPEKIDEPTKADKVTEKVSEFLNTLEGINRTLEQQEYGTMTFQKEVETIQIALSIAMEPKNPLPKHGIDGFFGPETAKAVKEYKKSNNITDEITEAQSLNEGDIPGIDEMVWNKMPWGVDAGNKQDGLKWDNHDTHIHFGFTTPETALAVIKMAQSLGLHAGENPFSDNNLEDVHKNNSFHYRMFPGTYEGKKLGKGLDVSGNSDKMKELFNYVAVTIGGGTAVSSIMMDPDSDNTQPTNNNPTEPITTTTTTSTTTPITKSDNNKIEGKETITPELAKSLLNDVKGKVTPEMLSKYVDQMQIIVTSPEEIREMVKVIVSYIEGGYYHPKMKEKNPQKFKLFGSSTETLFGIDRINGGWEKTSAGKEFFNLLDAENASEKWEYMYDLDDNPSLKNKLIDLSAQMIGQKNESNKSRFFTPEARKIVNGDAGLTFNFLYATYNGEGWFQKFAREINESVEQGTTDPKELLKIAIDTRKQWTSDKPHVTTLIRRTGDKVMGALQKFFRDYDQTNLV
jgi:hypothetical protein